MTTFDAPWDKEKMLVTSLFYFSHSLFFHMKSTVNILINVCHLQALSIWLVVLGFNATLTAKVISWRLVTHMCFLAFSHQYQHNLSFQSHRLLYSHASAEVRGENTLERKVASTGDRTQNHEVMSPTGSPLGHSGGAALNLD